MKAKLDESDKAKGNRLWQQTISVVHKHDANAALIAKRNKENMLTVLCIVTRNNTLATQLLSTR